VSALPAEIESSVLEVEQRGIQRVTEQERTDQTALQTGILWFTVNFVLSAVTTGALAIPAFGLGLWDSIIAILLFNALGILPVALFCTFGPLTGLRQMVIARFAFGWDAAKLTAVFNIAACIGWSCVNAIIGGVLLHSIWHWPFAICLLIIAGLTTLVSVYGNALVQRYERYAWIPLAVIFIVIAVTAAPHMHATPTPALKMAWFASWVSYGGAVVGFAIGWSSYASDYSVYVRKSVPTRSIFWWTFIGEFAACVLLETLGVLLTTWHDTAFGTDVLSLAVTGLGSFWADLVLLFLVLSVIANNIPNDYSLGLTVQVLGKNWESVKRWVWTLLGAAIYTAIGLYVVAVRGFSVSDSLTFFLLVISYWLGPFSIILILEHFVFRRAQYDLEGWDDSGRMARGFTPALIAFIVGLIGAGLGAYQVGPDYKLIGPIGNWFGGDLGFELGTVLAAIVFFALRRMQVGSGNRIPEADRARAPKTPPGGTTARKPDRDWCGALARRDHRGRVGTGPLLSPGGCAWMQRRTGTGVPVLPSPASCGEPQGTSTSAPPCRCVA
jgi:NCS1 nucleoside transporter family